MPDYPVNLAVQLASVRPAQALDLLGQILPIERLIGPDTGGRAQRCCLLLGPGDEIAVIKRAEVSLLPIWLIHRYSLPGPKRLAVAGLSIEEVAGIGQI